MSTASSILRISLAVVGGWLIVVLWFLLLTVGKSPLNQALQNLGITPLLTHSNAGAAIDLTLVLLLVQAVLVFGTAGLVAAMLAKDHELSSSLALGGVVVLTCAVWDSYIDRRSYTAVDLLIWSNGCLIFVLTGVIVQKRRLLKFFYKRMTKGAPQQPHRPAAGTHKK